MKGTIVKCLNEMIVDNFGEDKWQAIVKDVADMPKTILPISDVPDAKVMEVIQSTCKILEITLAQAADAFGDYWVNVYAQKYYASYFGRAKTAKEFISNMDHVHDVMTKNMKNAAPPRFEYEWPSDNELIFHYKSKRGLIDIAIGCLKGVGKFFKEDIKIEKLSEEKLRIVFNS